MRGLGRIVLGAAAAAMMALPAQAAAAPPPNDAFAAATEIAPAGGAVDGTNADATFEDGEPDHAGSGYGALHSVWFRWTAPVSGPARVATCGSAFNTRVGVYTGAAVGALAPVAANEDSAGPTCPGTAWSEVSFDAAAGTTYRIAVDTSGGVDAAGAPDFMTSTTRGPIALRLVAPPGSEPQHPQPPQGDAATTPATKVPRRVQRGVRIPRLIASCGPETPKGNAHCERGHLVFPTEVVVERFRAKLSELGIASTIVDVARTGAGSAANPAQTRALRERGAGGELMRAKIKLVTPDGEDETLTMSTKRDIATDELIEIRYTAFDLEKDKRAIAEERERLREAAEKLADELRKKAPKSRCLPIAAGETPKQIEARFPKPGATPYGEAIEALSKLGCDVLIARTVRGRPSIPTSYVKSVVRVDPKTDTVYVELAQPGHHDFVFTIRENPAEFASLASRANIPIGTDGNLTVSERQLNRFTVQVIERATGRLVAGAPVTFAGTTQTTDGNGETTFVVKVPTAGELRLSAEVLGMEGWRTVRAIDRDGRPFVSMAGRQIVRSTKGLYAGSVEAELELAKSLPVVPANLGSGNVGAVGSVPRVRQADVTTFDARGGQYTGSHNVVAVANDSNVLVGAAPGLVALAGGASEQAAARAALRQGAGPLELLGAIVGGLRGAIDAGVANIRTALGGTQQAAIVAIADALRAPTPGLISDKGLGVISTGGGNLIGQAGGNLISDNGASVISVGGGNLIGQAGGNLIGQAGGNLIGQAGGNVVAPDACGCIPVYGGKVISTGGLN
ncbi:MAG TPA: hypothetical protein VFR97_11370 [Capillimicrobium sp.]|nr:hypothetical protein [Capillimicrobium sp.]